MLHTKAFGQVDCLVATCVSVSEGDNYKIWMDLGQFFSVDRRYAWTSQLNYEHLHSRRSPGGGANFEPLCILIPSDAELSNFGTISHYQESRTSCTSECWIALLSSWYVL